MKRFATFLIAVVVASPVVKAENNGALGRKVDDFKLQDYRGAEHALSEITGKQATVIAFLGTECPLAKLYGPRLAELADKYASHGVAFVGIDANRQDSLSEISAYARTAGIKFPMLKDTGNSVADAMGATRTPDVFVLDKDQVVRYSGASTIAAESASFARRRRTIISPRHSTNCWPARPSRQPTSIRWVA